MCAMKHERRFGIHIIVDADQGEEGAGQHFAIFNTLCGIGYSGMHGFSFGIQHDLEVVTDGVTKPGLWMSRYVNKPNQAIRFAEFAERVLMERYPGFSGSIFISDTMAFSSISTLSPQPFDDSVKLFEGGATPRGAVTEGNALIDVCLTSHQSEASKKLLACGFIKATREGLEGGYMTAFTFKTLSYMHAREVYPEVERWVRESKVWASHVRAWYRIYYRRIINGALVLQAPDELLRRHFATN